MEWVSRITTVALMMVLPGIGGTWLDSHWETKFLGPLGFVVGMSAGIWHLIVITRPKPGIDDLQIGKRQSTPGKPSSPDKDRSS
jgi:hypothetical protein